MDRNMQVAFLMARKKQMIVGLLDKVCQQLEITDAQYETAKERYVAVGAWLADASAEHMKDVIISPQGSVAIGTTVKPVGGNEFDVDLVCHLPNLLESSGIRAVKDLIGDRLKEHGTYRSMLEEKPRCWRINYANEFHLDITPAIPNRNCAQEGVLVPDKALSRWKPTNPKGYIRRFEQYAAMQPRFSVADTLTFKEARAGIDPLPEQTMSKPFLKRIVQLLKRHRDNQFCGTQIAALAPISIIVTTLAARAYAKCAAQQVHTDAFDFIVAVIREMPSFIDKKWLEGRELYVIENETTMGENFAEKWNTNPQLASTFFEWHQAVLNATQSLLLVEGADQYAEKLSGAFGARKEQIREALAGLSAPMSQARTDGRLSVAPVIGLTTMPAAGAIAVPKNTFFGRCP